MTDAEDRLGSFDEPLSEDADDSHSEVPDPKAPTVEPPRPETPTTETPEPEEPRATRLQDQYNSADPEFKTLFWKLVLLYKLGIVGLSLGSLILLFDAHQTVGPALFLGGIAFTAHAIYLTRQGKTRLDDGEFDFDADDEPDRSTETMTRGTTAEESQ